MVVSRNSGLWYLNCSDVDAVRPKLTVEAVHHNLVCYPRPHCHLRKSTGSYYTPGASCAEPPSNLIRLDTSNALKAAAHADMLPASATKPHAAHSELGEVAAEVVVAGDRGQHCARGGLLVCEYVQPAGPGACSGEARGRQGLTGPTTACIPHERCLEAQLRRCLRAQHHVRRNPHGTAVCWTARHALLPEHTSPA